MIYYNSYRIIGGKPKLVVIDEDGNIIKNPTKEQKKEAILEKDGYVTYRKLTYIKRLDLLNTIRLK